MYPRRTTRRAIQVSSAARCSARCSSRPRAPFGRSAEDIVSNSTAQHEWIRRQRLSGSTRRECAPDPSGWRRPAGVAFSRELALPSGTHTGHQIRFPFEVEPLGVGGEAARGEYACVSLGRKLM